jgi:hypothetical protein
MSTRNLPALVLISLAALASSGTCFAGTASLVVNGRSYHLGSDYDWNENNIGLGIEYQLEQRSAWRRIAMANGFRDSADRMSYMAGFGLHRRLYETDKMAGFHVYAGLNAFVMTRQDMNGNRPFPGVLPSLSVGNRDFGINLTYLPRRAIEQATNATMADPEISGIFFLQFKVSMQQLLP